MDPAAPAIIAVLGDGYLPYLRPNRRRPTRTGEGPPIAATPSNRTSRSLVIPMFDEAGRIEDSLRTLIASGLCDDRFELVLVDDGSTDGTADLVEKLLVEYWTQIFR